MRLERSQEVRHQEGGRRGELAHGWWAWGGGMGWAVRVEAARVEPMPESAAAQGSVTAAGVREAVVAVMPWRIRHASQPASRYDTPTN